jgi:hypothetical protein
MSGPYPSGYPPPPEHDGWWAGNQQGNSYGGQSEQSDFPTVQYTGLGGQQGGGWGDPPQPPRRSMGRLVVAVVSVLVIVGGVATGIVLLQHKHTQRQAAQADPVAAPVSTPGGRSEAQATGSGPADPGVPNGSTGLTLADGSCVSAVADDEGQYTATRRATCGTPTSDLVLDTTTADMTGCAAHEYLRLSAPSTGVDCFTLDIKTGDCVDASYLKSACAQADFRVLTTEAGPGGDDSCTSVDGATHWVPVGRDPVRVGCLGAAAKS